jgi:O-methyltransferase
LNVIARRIARAITNFLSKPAVRYAYLPRLNEMISYNRKEAMLHTCFGYVDLAEVKGDYVEFGMWKGGSMIAAYHLSGRFPGLQDMRFYGFDSFQGIPSVAVNQSENEAFPPGMFRASLAEVQRNLRDAKVDLERVTLIEGWYADTLNEQTRERLPLKAAAIVNVDCDVYESAVSVLNFVEPYLVDGSILFFDDWYCFRNNDQFGQQKAFREWRERNRQLIKATPYQNFGWDGKAFIINRLASTHRTARQSGQAADTSADVIGEPL